MASGLLDIIKTAAIDAMDNIQMRDLRYGEVISISPLKIRITTQLILPESTLVVPEHLTDYSVNVTVDWETKDHTHNHTCPDGTTSNNTHRHGIVGKKVMIVHAALKVGDKVALLRAQGGQKYFILDRI